MGFVFVNEAHCLAIVLLLVELVGHIVAWILCSSLGASVLWSAASQWRLTWVHFFIIAYVFIAIDNQVTQ